MMETHRRHAWLARWVNTQASRRRLVRNAPLASATSITQQRRRALSAARANTAASAPRIAPSVRLAVVMTIAAPLRLAYHVVLGSLVLATCRPVQTVLQGNIVPRASVRAAPLWVRNSIAQLGPQRARLVAQAPSRQMFAPRAQPVNQGCTHRMDSAPTVRRAHKAVTTALAASTVPRFNRHISVQMECYVNRVAKESSHR